MAGQGVLYEADQKVGIVTLNRPDKLNALSMELRLELEQVLRGADEDPATSVIVKDKKQLDAKRPVAPIDLTDKITSPLLGIFGNEDKNPDIAQVNETEALLERLGKTYEFHRYDGVGHAFFNTWREGYKAPQALDGWEKVFDFYERYLAAA